MMNNQLNVVPEQFQSGLQLSYEFKPHLSSQLSGLAGKRVFFRSDFSKESIPIQAFGSKKVYLSYPLHEFASNPRERLVSATDSSCVLIGETEEGAIYAGRVAIVTATRSKIQSYYRAGPIIFYLDPSTIESELGSSISRKVARLIISDHSIAERFIRVQLERTAQIQTASSLSDSILLVDGSLRSSVLEPRGQSLRELERVSEENFNQILGISKATSIKIVSNVSSSLQASEKSSVFLDMTATLTTIFPSLENKILVAKFCPNAPVFRVDYSRANAEDEAQVFSDLKFNDLCFRGYPESLRLAHHLSVFDASTIASVRSYLSKQYRLVQVPSDDLRATILGKLV